MEVAWLAPDMGFLKVNVHWVQSVKNPHKGIQNRVGIIVRDSAGAKIWGAMGPLNGMEESQACLWAAQAGVLQAWRLGFHAIQVEFANRELYDDIRL